MVGATVGNQFGVGTMGRKAGKSMGARLSKLIGTGDYLTGPDDLESNSLIKPGARSAYGAFGSSATGVRLEHREYLQDVYSGPTAGAFSTASFPVNPALPGSFPYLAQIAANYEEYRFHGLVFEFVSTTSPYNADGAMGSTILAMEYNAAAVPFASKPQMENSDFAISARFDKSLMYGVECKDNATNHLFCRQGVSSLPLTTTDLGTMYVATQPASTFPINATLGELWVTYDVEFFRPRISSARFGYYHASYTLAAIPIGLHFLQGQNSLTAGGLSRPAVSYGSLSGVAPGPTTSLTFTGASVGDTYQITAILRSVTLGVTNLNIAATVGFTATSIVAYTTQTASAHDIGTKISVSYYTVTSDNVTPTITFSDTEASAAGTIDFIVEDIGNGLTALTL